LIATQPAASRSGSRLLALDGATGVRRDLRFTELPALLAPGDLLVRNDTRVLPARLRGRKSTGGAVEGLLERLLGDRRILAQLRASKSARPGQILELGGALATVLFQHEDFVELEFDRPVVALLEAAGEVPLPPYIDRPGTAADRERYQTVYARQPG